MNQNSDKPMLNNTLPGLNDAEGKKVPQGLPFVVDAHVHVFPEKIFSAIWAWFDTHAWPIRYRMPAAALLDYLFDGGVGHIVALQYAHKPGIAHELNRFMADLCESKRERVTGLAAVFPGEPGAARILKDAFAMGLKGVKLHAHVQCFDINGPEMETLYRVCADYGKPLIIHAGREPKSSAYACDPHAICSADRIEKVLSAYPDLKLCVPHLGGDEFEAYARMMETYDNLWVDTAMVVTDYLPMDNPVALPEFRNDRVMYGSDFPNIPYAWDRELRAIEAKGLKDAFLQKLLWENAGEFFDIQWS